MTDNVQLNTMSGGSTVATKDVGGIQHQIVVPYQQNRSDTYTTTATGVTVDVSTIPCSRFGMQVKGSGAAATAWTALLEASLDGTNFFTIMTHQNGVQVDGELLMLPLPAPVKKFRSRVSALTLGSATNIVVSIIGQASF